MRTTCQQVSLTQHKLVLVSIAIVNQRWGRGREGEGGLGLTNNVSVSLDKQVNIDLVESYV